MKHILLSLALWMSVAPFAIADQKNPQLAALFAELHNVSNQDQGLNITNQIWQIWHDIEHEDSARLLRSGVALMQNGQFTAALEQFERVVELSPEFAEGWNKRATILFYMNQYNASVADIEKTLELEPRHFGALSGLGMIYMTHGKYKAALVAFQSAHKINPHLPGVNENIARVNEILQKERI